MEHEHTVAAIHERLSTGPRQNYLRDWIYGGIDGAVTTLAVVSGVIGAQLSPRIILVMGVVTFTESSPSMSSAIVRRFEQRD